MILKNKLLSYTSCCNLMLNPSWDASQSHNVKNLKNKIVCNCPIYLPLDCCSLMFHCSFIPFTSMSKTQPLHLIMKILLQFHKVLLHVITFASNLTKTFFVNFFLMKLKSL